MLPTYFALPLLSAVSFFSAAFPSWCAVVHTSLPAAAGLAVLWVVLLAAFLYDSPFELLPVFTGFMTLFLAGTAARAVASQLTWPRPLSQVVVVELVMALLAVLNLISVWRERARRRRLPSK